MRYLIRVCCGCGKYLGKRLISDDYDGGEGNKGKNVESHGICSACVKKIYADGDLKKPVDKKK